MSFTGGAASLMVYAVGRGILQSKREADPCELQNVGFMILALVGPPRCRLRERLIKLTRSVPIGSSGRYRFHALRRLFVAVTNQRNQLTRQLRQSRDVAAQLDREVTIESNGSPKLVFGVALTVWVRQDSSVQASTFLTRDAVNRSFGWACRSTATSSRPTRISSRPASSPGPSVRRSPS